MRRLRAVLVDAVVSGYARDRGFRGADVLRRRDGQEIGFVTLTRFETIDAIRGFVGDDYEVAVLEPETIALLSRYEDPASHFVTASFLV